jgi:hypothetical protein
MASWEPRQALQCEQGGTVQGCGLPHLPNFTLKFSDGSDSQIGVGGTS